MSIRKEQTEPQRGQGKLPRRRLLKIISGMGIGSAAFGRAVVVLAEDADVVTPEMIQQAEWIAGLRLNEEKRRMVTEGINRDLTRLARLREVRLDNSVPPALSFFPVPPRLDSKPQPPRTFRMTRRARAKRPEAESDLAFAPVTSLAELIRTRQVSSVELTKLYLDRLRRFDPKLRAVISYTEDLALRQAKQADDEIAAGEYRGPLHGIPWGAKDLLAVPEYATTWGAAPYKEQVRKEKATVVSRLEQAGAVLVAKLSLGALAMGDVWFDAKTRNPWKLSQGSSGSSAGSAAATAAGLVGFAIGSETWGSIVSPCTRCGVTGLRPTFGRVSRHGAMTLAPSMDKLGPIARSVEDCALIFHAIHGSDGKDPSAIDQPFSWPTTRDIRSLRIGYLPSPFEADPPENISTENKARWQEQQRFDRLTLDTLRKMDMTLVPVSLPESLPIDDLRIILNVEAAAMFDELTLSGRDELLVRQGAGAWPNLFRKARFTPAVDYVRANRIRTLLLGEMERMMKMVDVYLAPTFHQNLLATNLTGHPAVVVPNGHRADDGTPTSITFTGQLHGESDLLAVAHAYQVETAHHLKRPPIEMS